MPIGGHVRGCKTSLAGESPRRWVAAALGEAPLLCLSTSPARCWRRNDSLGPQHRSNSIPKPGPNRVSELAFSGSTPPMSRPVPDRRRGIWPTSRFLTRTGPVSSTSSARTWIRRASVSGCGSCCRRSTTCMARPPTTASSMSRTCPAAGERGSRTRGNTRCPRGDPAYCVLGDGPVDGKVVLVQGGAGELAGPRWRSPSGPARRSWPPRPPERQEVARRAGADFVFGRDPDIIFDIRSRRVRGSHH